ncbi:MAG: terpene cyclase/mutase family protein [Candidatus Aminicenantes bacterium]|nr:terpene cyclase/mutase family protein [Candidatus Aminicenantes bacterium]
MKANTNKAIEFLLARGNLPILYWMKKDILDVPTDREQKNLKKFAARIRILQSQRSNGGWGKKKYEGPPRWEKTYYIVDTLKNAFLLYNFGCTSEDKGVQKLIKFLYSTQTREGDFRGAYLNEYAPTYHALTLHVLCLFGQDNDPRTQKGFRWFMRHRQNDGGWVIPYRTIDKKELKSRYNFEAQTKLNPVKPDKSQPSSHLVTGMVLRSLSASPTWRHRKETWKAGELLISRFFKSDKYEDRRNATYWKELTYPFWATDLLSSLDALSMIGFAPETKGIQRALEWLISQQKVQGYWEAASKRSGIEDHLWVTLVMLRVLKRFGMLEI